MLALVGCGGYWWHRSRPPQGLVKPPPPPAKGSAAASQLGRLYEVNGYPVLELSGTPEQMGEAHGRLLGETIRRVVADVLRPEEDTGRYARIIQGTKVMERYQPEPYRRELKALAKAAGVDYMDMVALQLFGDAERGRAPKEEQPDGRAGTVGSGHSERSEVHPPGRESFSATIPANPVQEMPHHVQDDVVARFFSQRDVHLCSNYAVFGPATKTGECIVGRNFDYWYESVARYASILIHYRPEKGKSFVTVSWAGVINGWSLMNEDGLVAANNNAFSGDESLAGVSTCFLQRLIIENAATVKEGIEIARKTPRAVGTVMLLAGGKPPDAVELEFDHGRLVARRAKNGYVIATNSFCALGYDDPPDPDALAFGRYARLLDLIKKNHGRIDRTMNFAAASGVAMTYINLHCATFFPSDRTFHVSMGKVPASAGPFRKFRMTEKGIVGAE